MNARREAKDVDVGVNGREGVTIVGRVESLVSLSLLLLLLLLAALPGRGTTFRESCFELRIFLKSCERSG